MVRLVLHLPFDHIDLSESVSRALDMYLNSVGRDPEILSEWCDVEGEEDLFPLDAQGWDLVRSELSSPLGERFLDDVDDPRYILRRVKKQFDRSVELSGGSKGLSGYGFFYWARLPWRTPRADEVSVVSFSWPTEYLETRGETRMREEIEQLAALLPYSSGHAGLAFFSANGAGPAMKDLHEEALRHPGLDVTHGQRRVGTRVDGVHWLNFLGPELLARMGGAEALRLRLTAPLTTVTEYKGGSAVVALGPEPEAGDMDRGDTLPAWRELAHVLEPWLLSAPEHLSWRGCPPETAHRWWRRFLD
ncbi:MAG: type VI immunity family protein [Cystobacter sp.]